MANTKAGGKTVRETMIKKYGSEEAYKEHMRSIGSKGGKLGVNGGFAAATPEQVRKWGAKGGRISRRRKQNTDIDNDL
jgi:uncharacterized protein